MAMVTRCPSCETLFRVTPQHLQACHGQVRCGRCMTVFDGFRGLATLPDQNSLEPTPRSAADSATATGFETLAPARAVSEPEPAVPRPESEQETPEAPEVIAEPARRTTAQTASPSSGSAVAANGVPYAIAAPNAVRRELLAGGDEPVPQAAEDGPRPRTAPGWSLGVILMLLALGAQALYVYRVELVSNYPSLKPVLVQFCDLLGCSVPLPQRPERIAIEASDLQVQDPQRPGVIQLTATLRNHAAFDVGLPALDLVLTNTKEHTLARRIFMPAEYLEQGRGAPAGLAANAEITIRLVLDTGDLGAAGFRLALLPAR